MSSTTTPTATTSAANAQKVAISIGVMLGAAFLMVEVAGTSHQAAITVGIILAILVMLRGMNTSSSVLTKLSSYPWIPGS